MEKTGWSKMKEDMLRTKHPNCQSCGEKATTTVTFEDNFGRLRVKLCDRCAGKSYESLRLQGRFSWPE